MDRRDGKEKEKIIARESGEILRNEKMKMSVKALRKQLAAAIAMVVVAAVALSSSTYAWFANNAKVTATGMQVQAQTEGGIEIAYTDSTQASGSYSTSASTGATSAIGLAPVSTLNTQAWFHAGAADASSYAGVAETYTTLSLVDTAISGQAYGKVGGKETNGTTTNYYMVQNFNIRSTSSTQLAKGLTVDTVSVAGNTKTMSEALRVAVRLGSNVLIYDPVANDTTSYSVYSGHTGSGESATKTKAGDVTCIDKNNPRLLANSADITIPAKGVSNNGGVDVQVYIWFEGEDTQLYSDNFYTEGLTITVQFSATV